MGKQQDRSYTTIAQALHWLIALLIVVQFVLARMAAPLSLGCAQTRASGGAQELRDDRADAGGHPFRVEAHGELWTTPEGLLQRSFRASLNLPGSAPICPEPH